MRLDKFFKNITIIKRRTVAKEVADRTCVYHCAAKFCNRR